MSPLLTQGVKGRVSECSPTLKGPCSWSAISMGAAPLPPQPPPGLEPSRLSHLLWSCFPELDGEVDEAPSTDHPLRSASSLRVFVSGIKPGWRQTSASAPGGMTNGHLGSMGPFLDPLGQMRLGFSSSWTCRSAAFRCCWLR